MNVNLPNTYATRMPGFFPKARCLASLGCFAAALWLAAGAAAAYGQGDPKVVGEWGKVIKWPNVGIHVHVLPNGKVLFWGRREWKQNVADPGQPVDGVDGELDTQECTPRIWDPANPDAPATDATGPLLRDGPETVNLFCSGHTFLPDGKLLVVGGHIRDANGSNKVRIFNWKTNQWEKGTPMDNPGQGGRWYPTAVTLPDGGTLVLSGDDQNGNRNQRLQVLRGTNWDFLDGARFENLAYYPWMHVVPDGRVFMAGSSRPRKTQLLTTTGGGRWDVVGEFNGQDREYGSSVMYEPGKVLITGGGIPPQETAEIIDLTKPGAAWRFSGNMSARRRQHNSTILPDGTVLVTGGTSGQGGPNNGFNDITAPVKVADLWIPPTGGGAGEFKPMAAESQPRLYHSTAVLLPDARVLSAGGGEYRPDNVNQNLPQDSLKNAQIFSPPYLFRGPQPDLTSAPAEVAYGQTFEAGTWQPNEIGRASWVRLSSVTHAFNQGQRINFLETKVVGGKLQVTAPANANLCPPGHYMLFLLSKAGVPSMAKTVHIQ